MERIHSGSDRFFWENDTQFSFRVHLVGNKKRKEDNRNDFVVMCREMWIRDQVIKTIGNELTITER